MTKNESKLLSLQWIAKTSAFCLLLSAFSVNAAMAVPASVGTVDEVMGVQQDKKVTGTVVDEAGIPIIRKTKNQDFKNEKSKKTANDLLIAFIV